MKLVVKSENPNPFAKVGAKIIADIVKGTIIAVISGIVIYKLMKKSKED